MTVHPAISLHQPWATLIATPAPCVDVRERTRERMHRLGIPQGVGPYSQVPAPPMVKRFETRSRPCPPKYIGQRVAIHAAKRVRQLPHEARPMIVGPSVNGGPRDLWPTGLLGEARSIPLPLGAVVATAVITASLPILDEDEMLPAGASPDAIFTSTNPLSGPVLWRDSDYMADLTDQLPYGDWTPGRFAWALADVVPLEVPVPWKGRQGWFTVELP